uniref:Uncharacterized protein n=1 Tax=Oryza glumipatula TaxID=40148 RepID=A0A0E0BMG8_9ORYZ
MPFENALTTSLPGNILLASSVLPLLTHCKLVIAAEEPISSSMSIRETGYIRHCRGNADSENWTCATHVEWAKRMRLFQP